MLEKSHVWQELKPEMHKLIIRQQQGALDVLKENVDGWARTDARTGQACDNLSNQLLDAFRQLGIPEYDDYRIAEEAKGEVDDEEESKGEEDEEAKEEDAKAAEGPVERLSRLVGRVALLSRYE